MEQTNKLLDNKILCTLIMITTQFNVYDNVYQVMLIDTLKILKNSDTQKSAEITLETEQGDRTTE